MGQRTLCICSKFRRFCAWEGKGFELCSLVFLEMWTVWGDDGYLGVFLGEDGCGIYEVNSVKWNSILEYSCLFDLGYLAVESQKPRFLWQHSILLMKRGSGRKDACKQVLSESVTMPCTFYVKEAEVRSAVDMSC